MALTISSRVVGDVCILDPAGMMVLYENHKLRELIKQALDNGHKKILLNMAGITYIDSSGVGEMVSAFTKIRNHGGDLKLVGLTQKTHDLLQITKLYTVFDVCDTEDSAFELFGVAPLRCCCPLCGEASGPPVVAANWILWPPQGCSNGRCEATFALVPSRAQSNAVVRAIRIQTYKDEHFELLSGPPYSVKIVGRLDLFSSSALKKSWLAIPVPRRVMFDLSETTEIDTLGLEALLSLLAQGEKDTKAAISLEGLAPEQAIKLPIEPPFFQNKVTALAALGDVSDTPPLCVTVSTGQR